MLQALEYGKPLANGYSGFFPPAYLHLREATQTFPDDSSLRELRDVGVTFLVVDRRQKLPDRLADVPNRLEGWRMVFADDAVLVYQRAP
jgi:hypothetical protein